MNKIILTLFTLTIAATAAFAQTEPYGPVPYKTLEQTIGETYTLVKLFYGLPKYDDVRNAAGNFVTVSDFGKSLKLIKIDEDHTAHFQDSLGLEYTDYVLNDKTMGGLILKSDLEAARKLFLNKTLWLNVTKINAGKNRDEPTRKEISGLRFEPVKVIDVSIGYVASKPILFTVKTTTGEIGFETLNISGTNTELEPEYAFGHFFLTEDPHPKYHFTPAVWQMVKTGYTEIGMPIDAFRLVMGFPKDIHTTQTAKGTTVQWVYGVEHRSYYYFTNGKLTAKQD